MALRRLPALFLAALLAGGGSHAAEDPLLLSLLEAKKAYREKRWADADAALRRLLELAAAPGREPALTKILPAYHFYAAAVAWERKDEERARQELARYFEFQPEATVDPGAYPKSYCIFFDAQRTAAERRNPAPPPPPGLADFGTTLPDLGTIPQYSGDPAWPATAVSFLLTEPEKRDFAALGDDAARREWVFRFWKKFDPDPATRDNEAEREFYRRVQYAEAHFSTETMRGSLSDRGRVLVVLGPPSYVGRSPLLQSEDTMTQLKTSQPVIVRSATGGGSLLRVPTTSRGGVTPGDIEGDVEIWYYRQDRVPKGLPFQELHYRFISKKGYGDAVFQKDARELISLQRAARLLRTGS
ncbi:MAG TPA: GWxTD domain-containing protein [Thermoanaerobaculia bacterium]